MPTLHSRPSRISIVVALFVLCGRTSIAQEPKWEVEVHAGGILSDNPARGTAALPPLRDVVVQPPVPLGWLDMMLDAETFTQRLSPYMPFTPVFRVMSGVAAKLPAPSLKKTETVLPVPVEP